MKKTALILATTLVLSLGVTALAEENGRGFFGQRGAEETEIDVEETQSGEAEMKEEESAPAASEESSKEASEEMEMGASAETEKPEPVSYEIGKITAMAPADWTKEEGEDDVFMLWLNEDRGVYVYAEVFELNNEFATAKEYFDRLEPSIYEEDEYGLCVLKTQTPDFVMNGMDVRRMYGTFTAVGEDREFYSEDILMMGGNQLTHLVFECLPEDYIDYHAEFEAFLTSFQLPEEEPETVEELAETEAESEAETTAAGRR